MSTTSARVSDFITPAYPPRKFPCMLCETTVDTVQNWRGHAKQCHAELDRNDERYRLMIDKLRQWMQDEPIRCPIKECGAAFRRFSSMATHFRVLHSHLPANFRRPDLHRCILCDTICYSASSAFAHVKEQHAERLEPVQGGEEEEEEEEEEEKANEIPSCEIETPSVSSSQSCEGEEEEIVHVSPTHTRPALLEASKKRVATWAAPGEPPEKRPRSDGLRIRVPVSATNPKPTVATLPLPRLATQAPTAIPRPRLYCVTSPECPGIEVFHVDGMPIPKLGAGTLILREVLYDART